MTESELTVANAKAVFSSLLRREVISLERVGGGRNSRIYKLDCGAGESFAGKIYFRHESDPRDRMGIEFSSLQFLWGNGIRDVPQPIAADPAHGCAVYEFIDSERIESKEVTPTDVDAAANFLAKVKKLRGVADARKLPSASDSAFSLKEAVEHIEQRLVRLRAVEQNMPLHSALRDFLKNDFSPALEKIVRWSRARHSELCWKFDKPLREQERTLSPSDFGFHNARRRDGHVAFLDFEYFGWDDAAKMISDFLLHPAMQLDDALKRQFVGRMLAGFDDFPLLAKRLEVVYPVFGLNWCLIILNEFVPGDLLRRQFAVESDEAKAAIQERQLSKAQRLLANVMRTHEKFSFYD